ncbi:MAG: response regulator transcription factor, partial [Solirubrobacteraceae bacterium]
MRCSGSVRGSSCRSPSPNWLPWWSTSGFRAARGDRAQRGASGGSRYVGEPAAPGGGGRLEGRLTARQLQVVALLADGQRYGDIAACLSISAGQVHRHVARAIERLGVRGVNELVAVAVAEGMLPGAAVAGAGAGASGQRSPDTARLFGPKVMVLFSQARPALPCSTNE